MSELSEEWKKLRQQLGQFMCKLDNATNRAIVTDEQRKQVYDAAFESGWVSGRNDLWDRIDDYFAVISNGTERHKLASYLGHTGFGDIVSVMSPDAFTEKLTEYHNVHTKTVALIQPGDECYYLLSGDGYDKRFIITKIRDGEKEKFFDGIFHDGQTISDGALRLVVKTGNYYPVLNSLCSPFDEKPAEDKNE